VDGHIWLVPGPPYPRPTTTTQGLPPTPPPPTSIGLRLPRKLRLGKRSRNEVECKIDWQFTTADARVKLKRLYPVIQPVNSGLADH